MPGSWVLFAVVARTPHVSVQVRVDRSGVRGLCRSYGSDLPLAARPGSTHSVVLKISDVFVYLADSWHLCLMERRVVAPHRMQRYCEFPRQRDLCSPWPRPFSDRPGPGAQVGAFEVLTEERVRGLEQALAGKHVAAFGYPTVPANLAGFISPRG